MVKSVRISRAFLVLLGAALAGCGSDGPTENTVGAAGSLSFTYTGAGAASATQYSATGAIPANPTVNNGSQPWAAGGIDGSSTVVWAVIPKSSNAWDMTFINIARTTQGSSTIDPNCSSADCTDVAVWFGANNNETNFTYYCLLTTGTVNITAISSTTITGTFSGSGTCAAAAGGETPFTVTNGTFSVGITTLL